MNAIAMVLVVIAAPAPFSGKDKPSQSHHNWVDKQIQRKIGAISRFKLVYKDCGYRCNLKADHSFQLGSYEGKWSVKGGVLTIVAMVFDNPGDVVPRFWELTKVKIDRYTLIGKGITTNKDSVLSEVKIEPILVRDD